MPGSAPPLRSAGLDDDVGVWSAIATSVWLVFVAELGDRSQLMAMALATRVSPWRVLIGISVAAAAVHVVSVGLGSIMGSVLSPRTVNIVGGLAFVAFGLWALRGDGAHEVDVSASVSFFSIAGLFFVAELGDKTMWTTTTLAARGSSFGVWLGSTVGMIAADGLAVFVGAKLGSRLSARGVRFASAAVFVLTGVVMIGAGIRR